MTANPDDVDDASGRRFLGVTIPPAAAVPDADAVRRESLPIANRRPRPRRAPPASLLRQVLDRPRDVARHELMEDIRILHSLPGMSPEETPWELFMMDLPADEEIFYYFLRLFPLYRRWRREVRVNRATGERPDYCQRCSCLVCAPQHTSQ